MALVLFNKIPALVIYTLQHDVVSTAPDREGRVKKASVENHESPQLL
jgi:hypothetical protein